MFGYLVWNKAQCKDLQDEPNLGHVVFQTTDITEKDEQAGFQSVCVCFPDKLPEIAGYLHKFCGAFLDIEGYRLLLPETQKLYEPLFR